jgi:hypothetical protein
MWLAALSNAASRRSKHVAQRGGGQRFHRHVQPASDRVELALLGMGEIESQAHAEQSRSDREAGPTVTRVCCRGRPRP